MDMDLHMEEWVQFSLFCYSPLFEGLLYIYFSLFLSLSLYPLYSLSKPFARLCFISVCLFQSTKKVEQQNPLALLSGGWCNGSCIVVLTWGSTVMPMPYLFGALR